MLRKVMAKQKTKISTKLLAGEFLPTRTRENYFDMKPYRNSNSEKEGLTIPLKEFIRFGVSEDLLKVGAKFKLAIWVGGKAELPSAERHLNVRGGYIPDSITRYHEALNHLMIPRIKMGERRKGSTYILKVDSISWDMSEVETTTEIKTEESEKLPSSEWEYEEPIPLDEDGVPIVDSEEEFSGPELSAEELFPIEKTKF